MRTFHWIVQYHIEKMGTGHLLLFNRIFRSLERELDRAKKSKKVEWFDGILKQMEKDGYGKRVVILKARSVGPSMGIATILMNSVGKTTLSAMDESQVPKDYFGEKPKKIIGVESLKIKRYDPNLPDKDMSPKKFGEKKLGKKKKNGR